MELPSKLLSGKTALITGASRGIGKAVAELFVSSGADLILCSRNEASLENLREKLSASGQTVHYLHFNVSVLDEVTEAFRKLQSITTKLDILVNNAGIMKDAPLGMITNPLLHDVFGTNTFGALFVMQNAARFMMRQRAGVIVNVGSVVGTHGASGQVVYAGSKAALAAFTVSAAKELAPFGVRVNAVAPGVIDTDLFRNLPERTRDRSLQQTLLTRVGSPEDVARCCLFLASDLSAYVTGQILTVDGGLTL